MKLHNGSKPITIRNHRPGDMGFITSRHGVIYSREHGYSEVFEAMVGNLTADFLLNYEPAVERCWVAESDDQFLGCIMLVKDRTVTGRAKLRCFLVEEAARGSGLGTELIRLCLEFAREAGYERIGLATDSHLSSARRLYSRFGFEISETKEHQDWGERRTGEIWEMKLR